MMRLWRLALLGICFAAASCDDPPPDSSSPSGPSDVVQITGAERIGWDQDASGAGTPSGLRYILYIDDAGVELQDATCADTEGEEGYACSVQLPSMSPGRHSLALAAYVTGADGTRLESERSAPLTVILVEAVRAIRGAGAQATGFRTLDGVAMRVTEVAAGLADPTDLAFAPDGRMFVAERSGRIHVIAYGRQTSAPATADVVATGRYGLLSIATDPDFLRTPYLYAVYTSADGYRLARFRAQGDRLVEPRVLLDGIDPSPVNPAALVRFGPDGRLYLALDDGGDPMRPGDLGSFNGKVLRLNPDATTPTDQAGGTPVFALNVSAPIGMDWDAAGVLWIGEALPGAGARDGRLQLVVAPPVGARRGTTVARYGLPAGADPSGVAFYRGRLLPAFRDDLFLATSEGLLRLRVDPADPRTIVAAERMLREAAGARAIGVGPDGAIYLCTPDAVLRLTPDDGA